MRDNEIYTSEMMKSIWDKAFFMDKIPGTKCVIDFGCADGSMIYMLAPLFPDIEFIGYDNDQKMYEQAFNGLMTHDFIHNIIFFKPEELYNMILYVHDHWSDNICLNFSCVLHEVFSFGQLDAIKLLLQQLKPKYITIRDMYYHGDYHPINQFTFNHIVEDIPDRYIQQFQDKYEPMRTWKGLTHFLMKYRWKDNGWEEEMEENYYSWDIQKFNEIGYDTIYENHYQLPYLLEKWNKEYGFYNPDAHTHAQFILRRV